MATPEVSSTSSVSKRLQWAEPPDDNPRRRIAELSEDIIFAGETVPDATGAAGELRRVASLGTGAQNYARLRLRALADVKAMRRVAALTPTTRGVSNWVQMGPTAIPHGQTYSPARVFVTGRVTALAIHPTQSMILYVGTARGGVWRTTDGGHSWSPLSDNEDSLAIGALALAPSNPNILYAGTGEGNLQYYVTALPFNSSPDNYYGAGVLKSTDGGDHWTLQGSTSAIFAGAGFFRLAIHPTDPEIVFAATSHGLFRTIDGGSTWVKLTSGLPAISNTIIAATDVVIDPATPDTVYAAFFGDGIYRTNNATATTPTWRKQTGALPTARLNRIALALAPSSPAKVYALFAHFTASGEDKLAGLYCTAADGTWVNSGLDTTAIASYATYTMDLAVDPATPDIVYIAGVSLHKAMLDTATGVWSQMDVGSRVHPDTHCVAIDPRNHLLVYVGNDGGIYRSSDGAATWDDTINEGLCITQFEYMDQHPTSDAMCIGGTQDNGTEMFCNSPVFHHADDGDGGFVLVDHAQPQNILSTYFGKTPKRSTSAGRFGTWRTVAPGLLGNALFYPPMALDQTNANNIAFGTNQINLDPAQGLRGWPTKVALPNLRGVVSALHYVNSSLIYCATTHGQIFRLTRADSGWTASPLHAAPLPTRWIWDVAARPDQSDTVIVAMSGFGTGHVWRGVTTATGATTWTDQSGVDEGRLPDVPINSLVIDPAAPDTMYAGTDIGVFRTTDGGTHWRLFNDGLPNVAVYDMRLHAPTRLLRAATHGRGMWERQLDLATLPDVHLFVRDHIAATGRVLPTPAPIPAPFDDALHHVGLGEQLWWHQCADIKVDALEGAVPSYQSNVADVNYIAFETKLAHRNPHPGRVNRVYAQVRNRGIQAATDVTVKVLYTNAGAGLPDLPPDFWTAFPGNDFDQTHWKPIHEAKVIPALSPTEPAILAWEWATPAATADHTCLLMIVNCADDPIPAAGKVTNVATLVRHERRVGLKNLHVVQVVTGAFYWTPYFLYGDATLAHDLRILPTTARAWEIGLLFPKQSQTEITGEGMTAVQATAAMKDALQAKIGSQSQTFDTDAVWMVANAQKGGQLTNIRLPKAGIGVMLLLSPRANSKAGAFTMLQEAQGDLVGGSTFVLRTKAALSTLAPKRKSGPVF